MLSVYRSLQERKRSIDMSERFARLLEKAKKHYFDGNYQKASSSCRKILSKDPRSYGALLLTGLIANGESDYWKAVEPLRKAYKIRSDSDLVCSSLAIAYLKTGDCFTALQYCLEAIEINPDLANHRRNLAVIYEHLGNWEKAIESYESALSLSSYDLDCMRGLGNALRLIGEIDSSRDLFLKILQQSPFGPVAVESLSSIGYYDKGDRVEKLEEALKKARLSKDAEIAVNYALFSVYQKKSEYQKAFAYLLSANRKMRELVDFDSRVHEREIANLKRYFGSLPDRKDIDGLNSKRLIFVVGMPRSGTSLVEQIVDSHSEVYGAGELDLLMQSVARYESTEEGYSTFLQTATHEHFGSVAKYYVRTIAKFSPESRYVVDKNPRNYLRVGLIRLLFPEAKIVHVQRNPMATCFSCYQTKFAGAYGFSYDLEKLACYYRSYKDLMNFWNEKFPGQIYHLDYESLVLNFDRELKSLLAYLDLRYEESCSKFHQNTRVVNTASNDQVKEQLYNSSLESWKNYAAELDPLAHALL
tara:strand:- start:198 stop:1787 length:1590 start_codon:yes stop_codon:yes gene_type:complete